MTAADELLPNVVHEDDRPVKLSEFVEALVQRMEERLATKADRQELEATLLVHLSSKTDLAAIHAEIEAIKHEQMKLRNHIVSHYASSQQLHDVIQADVPDIVHAVVRDLLNARHNL